MPLVQIVFAGADMTGVETEIASRAPEAADFQAVKMGDSYLRFVRSGDESLSVQLYDSHFNPIATSEDEVAITFSLPSGEKRVFAITSPTGEQCSMDSHSSGGDCCPAPAEAASPAGCPHEETSGQD
jgi:hypothetical protein